MYCKVVHLHILHLKYIVHVCTVYKGVPKLKETSGCLKNCKTENCPLLSCYAATSGNLFAKYNQQDATFLKFIYFCKTLYTFQTVFPVHHQSTKLHIERQVFVRPLLLPAASLPSSR